ncbi:protein Wnt-7b isoform X2 [Plodia interpunctella]|uniref:protein Wnt-7b isoform X2 n=1 Tax=Plodia interpunctella TaxID=58824 RepID=UPI0023682DF8|nr:protein Wnt-7b-like isoform X2 [Plodia interpunctella]
MSVCVCRVRSVPATTVVLLLLCLRSVSGSGRVVSAGGFGARLVCARGLTARQAALCRSAPAHVAQLGIGLSMAYAECRSQLSGRRWNCSGVGDSTYGHVMPRGTREAAFTYAITAAGATHALSAACARGDLPACGCNNNRLSPSRRRGAASLTSALSRAGAGAGSQFQWGGCGEAAAGARFARKFLDARELEADARSLMNLHNNRVGRKMVKDLIRQECKCHGVSGSCTVQTCWQALPPFRAVAAALRDKYRRAKLVAPRRDLLAIRTTQFFVKRRHPDKAERQPRRSELVYLESSPSYCEPDPASGHPGTHGRHCNNTSKGEDGCSSLCCGRGHSTVRALSQTQCRCRFHWCCRVRCDTCTVRTDTHVCN